MVQLAVAAKDVHVDVVLDPRLPLKDPEEPAECRQDGLAALPDQVRVLGPEGGRGLLQVVVGDAGEQVVDLVGADVVHQTVRPPVVAVHRAQVAADKVPGGVAVPRHTIVL